MPRSILDRFGGSGHIILRSQIRIYRELRHFRKLLLLCGTFGSGGRALFDTTDYNEEKGR